MAFQPITITRIDAANYIVGRVRLVRIAPDRWIAGPEDGGRALFEASTLEEILELAHGACEMMRPA